ncbi:unnamed protein product [Lymnaea stagnalis]|uniref:Uncharacterized protein n=1 Tax=Lymnaea stagnalis TaxID=6523 RepID=A0AAV2IKS7_LYMST
MMSLAAPTDRKRVLDKQMEKLQQQLVTLEKQMQEQAALRGRLEQISSMDSARTQRALERASSSHRTLQGEIDRIYHHDERSPSPRSRKALEEIIAIRTIEFQRSQAEKAAKIQQLAQERLRILEARDRLKAKHEMFRSLPSPIGSEIEMRTPGVRTPNDRVHSTDSYIRRTLNDLPDATDRIYNLRDSLHKDYVRTKRPYAGELGIESYEPRQIPTFHMVYGLVNNLVDDIIHKNIPADHKVWKQGIKLKMLNEKEKDWQKTSKALAETASVKLVAEEIMLEVTGAMTTTVASDSLHRDLMYKKMSSNMFMKEAEVQATGNMNGREPSDPAYDMITRTFYSLQKYRDHYKKNIWSHSQIMRHPTSAPPLVIHPVTLPPPPSKKKKAKIKNTPPPVPLSVPQPQAMLDNQPLDADVHLITFDHLHPVDLKVTESQPGENSTLKNNKFWTNIYKKREAKYWSNLKPRIFNISVARHCQGVTVVCPSPDHMQLAVGTTSGDVIIFNTQVEPWSPVKFDVGQIDDGCVVHLAWSLDSSRICAVKKSGSVCVWLTSGRPANKEHLRRLELPSNDVKAQPFSLIPLHVFYAKQGDLTITQGSLVDQGTPQGSSGSLQGRSQGQERAVLAVFFPSLTFFQTQHSICTALNMGDVLKLDLETLYAKDNSQKSPVLLKPKIETKMEVPNLVRQKIRAELLREHRSQIIHLGFIGNIGKMVTVDRTGFICIWKYDRTFLSGFDWFLPEKKFKLNMSKTSYVPAGDNIAKIVFTDQTKSVPRSKIAQMRNKAQQALNKLQLGDPWHVSSDSRGLDTYMYTPHGGASNIGAIFNIVVRHRKTQQLSKHVTRMYKPVQVNCTRLITVRQTPSGNDLVIVLLFPAHPPKDPHLTILVLNLQTMKLRDLRKDVSLTIEEHNTLNELKILSVDITQTYGPTGSEYLFMTLNGRLSCISLNTGAKVMCAETLSSPKAACFPGLTLDERQFRLSRFYKVTAMGNFGALFAVLFERSSTAIKVIRLHDGNFTEDTQLMSKAFQIWNGVSQCPSELRVNPVEWALPDMKHKEAEMRSFLMSLLPQSEEITQEEQIKEKIDNYLVLQKKVDQQALLENL